MIEICQLNLLTNHTLIYTILKLYPRTNETLYTIYIYKTNFNILRLSAHTILQNFAFGIKIRKRIPDLSILPDLQVIDLSDNPFRCLSRENLAVRVITDCPVTEKTEPVGSTATLNAKIPITTGSTIAPLQQLR